jgi:choline dehydrogenase
MPVTVDYVVVGAGSAGCAVANRLSESGRHSVLLLEAGPSDRRFWIELPIGYGFTFHDPALNWRFRTEAEPGLEGRTLYVPRGKVLGGSSAINAMVYARGSAADFEGWAAEGNPGWGWADVLATYRRLEDHALGASDLHGAGGPLGVSVLREPHPTSAVFVAAGEELGFPRSDDLNGATIEGVGFYQTTIRDGRRMSSARAYLRPARGRPNLRVFTGAQATRVLFEGRRATGVEWVSGAGRPDRAVAAREVILCAGAIGSPQLLELSGVGDPAALAAAGIETRHALPAVGAHLQDHACYDHAYRARVPTLNAVLGTWAGRIGAAAAWALFRRGPLGLSLNQAGGFVRSQPGAAAPDLQLYFSPLTYSRTTPGKRDLLEPDAFQGFCVSISPCRPTSRGATHAVSPDWRAAPAIRTGLLTANEDVALMVDGAKLLRRLAGTRALGGIIEAEMAPGPAVATDADFEADARARAYSVYHPCGTARMGPDPARAAVDARLRVHGLGGLRVVDASVFPFVPSGNINAPSIMTGERGAQLILEDAA